MSGRRRVRAAEERLRRLLVVLPWLMERGSTPVAEAAERFGVPADELVADLELASMCGLPPYVDELVDVFIDEGMVHVGVPRLFTRPLRLNAVEAFELVLAGRAAMEMRGADPDGPLGRGLVKLESWLDAGRSGGPGSGTGVSGEVTPVAGSTAVPAGEAPPAVAIDLVRPPLVDELVHAVRRVEELELQYRSVSTDVVSERVVVPRQVFVDRGRWYVLADDDRTGERRTFRIDRIVDLVATGRFHDPDDDPLPSPGTWFADGGVERVTLELRPGARWVVERYPVDEVRARDDGTIEVVLPVATRGWLERLLVRLGPEVTVIAPIELRGLGAAAARRLLARYEGT